MLVFMIFNSVVIAKVNESNVINIKDISTNEYLHYVESFNFTDEDIINLYQIDAENFGRKIKLPEELVNRRWILKLEV